ncbi:type B DNA-directed DNA polymerase [Candidatus Methanocrinis natronophilus]|uniref:DNA-directed DNA polymerase n=1 Tax=Candidatus Methanocrinis natronophilus TaxID=3033396 RepID=A0ABT5X6V3_9EURY|nr:type B DNA-directed DNA polymerase [Candidatus Methanocrinis natronophilus]MDF0590433.1 type B DNA-directed DNA polymerase [Candidatus Methanocrinis natronophilus]
MWIFDSYHRGAVELWDRERDSPKPLTFRYQPSFYLYLEDPHAHWEMIEGLECRFKVKECSFDTVYGSRDGYEIWAGRDVALKIEKQTHMQAQLYNVDLRIDQRYLADKGIFPCGDEGESRFDTDFEIPLTSLKIKVNANPQLARTIVEISVQNGGRERRLKGSERLIMADLFDLVRVIDPDVILFQDGDQWVPRIVAKAEKFGLDPSLSRTGWFRTMASKSYWSYGKVEHKTGAVIPEGRILIDTENSFTYRESGIEGIILASRLTGLSPNLTSRFTPGTLISNYEVYEALRRGIAVPFRKHDAERQRKVSELKGADKGGMIFQPKPGVYEGVYELDFTSFYPSIIVNYNLSPETLDGSKRRGFLSSVIEPLLDLRLKTKKLKKVDPRYRGFDSVLKWMLVTCFGYTGYKNAKFGRIEVHESITSISRDLLLQAKDIAESMNLEVLHGIVDCLWVKGGDATEFKERVEVATGIGTELEPYDWIVFLPLADGFGAYNRYYGRMSSGKLKVRGVAARKRDTPEYIRRMQMEVFAKMGEARSIDELRQIVSQAQEIVDRYHRGIQSADPSEMVIHRRISKLHYERRCVQASAIDAYRKRGVKVSPGMTVGFVVRDAGVWDVDTEWDASEFDSDYYGRLIDKAWEEAAFVFKSN